MNIRNRQPERVTSYRAPLLITVALGLGLFAGSLAGQWLVHDPATLTANQAGFASQLAKTIEEYSLQAQQYTTQLQQLQNMLTSVESLGGSLSIAPVGLQPLSPADSAWLVQQNCPGAPSAGIAGSLMVMLQSTAGQSLAARQQTICAAIEQLKVDEYNITANALGELTRQASTVQQLRGVVDAISSIGLAASANAEAQGYLADLHTASATWKSQIDADDAMIAALQRQQSTLGRVALKGSNTIVGNLVQAAAFATAFH